MNIIMFDFAVILEGFWSVPKNNEFLTMYASASFSPNGRIFKRSDQKETRNAGESVERAGV